MQNMKQEAIDKLKTQNPRPRRRSRYKLNRVVVGNTMDAELHARVWAIADKYEIPFNAALDSLVAKGLRSGGKLSIWRPSVKMVVAEVEGDSGA
jgi:hypothetical protein